MASVFVPNQNINATIAVESPGHIFAAGKEPLLGQAGSLDCLRLCILSPGQSN